MSEPIPRIPTTLGPKQDFIRDGKRADAHQEIMMSPAFRYAAQLALAQYACSLASRDLSTQATSGLMMKGAREVLEVLMNLGVPSVSQSTEDMESLTET